MFHSTCRWEGPLKVWARMGICGNRRWDPLPYTLTFKRRGICTGAIVLQVGIGISCGDSIV